METKFHLLAIGQHFAWEGKRYVKSTPLIASELPAGGQKFMPRAALVTVEDGLRVETPPEPDAPLDSTRVHAAIARYHQRAVQLIEHGDGERRDALEQYYRELLAELKR